MTTTTRRSLVQIRWHGRGGQGAVTASNLLAQAALEDGRYFQSFPDFGAERSGAPVIAYSRVSDSAIHIRSQVTEPHIVMVLDSTLIGKVDLLAGLQEDGAVLVNTSLSPEKIRERFDGSVHRIATVDGTRIAMELLGRNIPNVPMLGGLLRIEEVVSQDAVLAAIRIRLGTRLREQVINANLEAFHRAYQDTRVG